MKTDEIKEALKAKKIAIGTKETLKGIKRGNISKIIISEDCPKEPKDSIEFNAKIAGIEIEVYNKSSKELGTICKKPFQITVLSIKK